MAKLKHAIDEMRSTKFKVKNRDKVQDGIISPELTSRLSDTEDKLADLQTKYGTLLESLSTITSQAKAAQSRMKDEIENNYSET